MFDPAMMKKMTGRRVLWFCLDRLLTCSGVLAASDGVRADDNTPVDKVKSTWRAQDGETVEQIISKVSKVAHFVPRSWEVAQEIDGGEYVFFSWTRHRHDKTDGHAITWKVTPDGAIKLESTYAKPMELGWQAFALSLIVSEVIEEERAVNLRFLHDPANFNFVTTAQGKLGDLLRRGRCTIVDPVGVDYLPKVDEKPTVKGDLWRVLLLVNCNIPGPPYFTRGAIITFEKREGDDWEPQSPFARRIAAFPPGSWFDHIEPKEQEALDGALKALANERREQVRGAGP
ncbi:nodulate formation efficiency C protein [Bradyrhizobium japonicum]|uniref:nodulate formation efficiency C protein n=1 Tax=Bradyrhizobium japonicum TaxID=375 RepID=UPI001E2C3D95|nr:nodulate formation efficiency C protein [Bradyrhizobium japonicum]MCD9825460.1 nodulate formation efficiency C protein [Bradyrhizobium japonicum]MCD9898411.1 nodulate formation efficiency C protein [Bradyrhizobium japonicum]MEB2671188.1 nodulate formation efficiency C protein [Bradyrhizobium japonicum]WLB28576.1 nodulate formation efficiency C protein [Bradyrhizobium japonicum]WRI90507.1 nodulate formation efficiency C protein [Bradyrhizobium japonicum]